MRAGFRRLVVALCLAVLGSAVEAGTIIDFEGLGLPLYGLIPPGYKSLAPGTPNVGVSYFSDALYPGNTDTANLAFWTGGYGDLKNVGYPNVFLEQAACGLACVQSIGFITLTPAAGYEVVLTGFDVAGFGQNAGLYPGGNIPYSWTIFEGMIAGPSASGVFGPGGDSLASHVSFSGAFVSTSPVTIKLGGDWNVAIDNIAFDQVAVPEPGTMALTTLGLLALGILRRARH